MLRGLWQNGRLKFSIKRSKQSCLLCRRTCKPACLRISELLEGFGPQHVGMPHVRPLGEKLWEMRLMGSAGIDRAIYTAASGRRLIVLHAFVKKTQKTPQRAIDAAHRRMREIKS